MPVTLNVGGGVRKKTKRVLEVQKCPIKGDYVVATLGGDDMYTSGTKESCQRFVDAWHANMGVTEKDVQTARKMGKGIIECD